MENLNKRALRKLGAASEKEVPNTPNAPENDGQYALNVSSGTSSWGLVASGGGGEKSFKTSSPSNVYTIRNLINDAIDNGSIPDASKITKIVFETIPYGFDLKKQDGTSVANGGGKMKCVTFNKYDNGVSSYVWECIGNVYRKMSNNDEAIGEIFGSIEQNKSTGKFEIPSFFYSWIRLDYSGSAESPISEYGCHVTWTPTDNNLKAEVYYTE